MAKGVKLEIAPEKCVGSDFSIKRKTGLSMQGWMHFWSGKSGFSLLLKPFLFEGGSSAF